MGKLTDKPTMDWLRLTSPQERVMLIAWTADSIVLGGRDLNIAHRLERRGLLRFVSPINGGLQGEFELTDVARDYPPIGLKALLVRRPGRRALSAREREG